MAPLPAAVDKTSLPKADKLQLKLDAQQEVVTAARALVDGWEATGFYDRQDPASALALHEALTAYEHKR